ncbi:hypothetical protein BDV36DRAFT_207584 [Aspergillus pseudocaelatus]|uniref:Uncharacterized protein n=1 Tax=Aspergillus pseudocaelatus TaxID=1825620 RepID=A0ABQ6WGU9_9EURO|nr:hypothetical protein BDV36DRAFT_207584 [Aspergillus pseudocaelatus]
MLASMIRSGDLVNSDSILKPMELQIFSSFQTMRWIWWVRSTKYGVHTSHRYSFRHQCGICSPAVTASILASFCSFFLPVLFLYFSSSLSSLSSNPHDTTQQTATIDYHSIIKNQ